MSSNIVENCMFCGGKIEKEDLSDISEFKCVDCDCLMDIDEDKIELKSDMKFYLANYGTEENVEIFTSYDEALNESINDEVHEAVLNYDCIWYDHDLKAWNYEDDSNLFLSTPLKVKKISKELSIQTISIIRVSKTGSILSNLKCTANNLIRFSKSNSKDIDEVIKSLLKRRFHSLDSEFPNMRAFLLKYSDLKEKNILKRDSCEE